MENQTVQNPIQNPIPDPVMLQEPLKTSNSPILIILSILLIIMTGVVAFLGYQNWQLQKQVAMLELIPSLSPTVTTDPTADWKTYEVNMFGLSLKLPPNLDVSKITKTESSGEVGKVICWTFPQETTWLVKRVLAGGQCGPNRFGITTVSEDFEAGRMSSFTDTKGYLIEKESIFYIGMNGSKILVSPKLTQIINNPNGVEILKVKGATDHDDSTNTNFPISGTPGEGFLGAIILTNNEKYPAISLVMKTDSDLNDNVFDQILSTFKFTNTSSLNIYTDPQNRYTFSYPSQWKIIQKIPDNFLNHDFSSKPNWRDYINSPEGLSWWLDGKMFLGNCRGTMLQNTDDTNQLIALDIIPVDDDGMWCWSVGYFPEGDKWKVTQNYMYPITDDNSGKRIEPEWKGDFVRYQNVGKNSKWTVAAVLANRETYTLKGIDAFNQILSTFKFED